MHCISYMSKREKAGHMIFNTCFLHSWTLPKCFSCFIPTLLLKFWETFQKKYSMQVDYSLLEKRHKILILWSQYKFYLGISIECKAILKKTKPKNQKTPTNQKLFVHIYADALWDRNCTSFCAMKYWSCCWSLGNTNCINDSAFS